MGAEEARAKPATGAVSGERTAPAGTEPLDDTEPAPESDALDTMPVVDPSRYVIEGEIGRGGHGRILNARDVRLGRAVAVKEMLRASSESVRRFVREALITARLQHPGIVPVHEAGRWPTGELFYTMKRVSGRPLEDLIASARTFEERLAMLPQVIAATDAIAYAHARGIIHRDVKPANVLVGEFGETVVVDWGVAKRLGDADDADDSPAGAANETRAGRIVGTPAYMPPEQARGEPVDERADVYALGATLHQLFTGAPPGDDLRACAPRLPQELVTIVEKATARDKEQRYRTAKELADDLKRFQAGQLVGAHRYSTWTLLWRWLKRYRAVVAFLFALLVVGVISVVRIVAERNVAEGARRAAEQASADLRANNHLLRLQHARAELDRDPTAAIAWLKTYPPEGPGWEDVGAIAQDAWSRGVARYVWHGDPPMSAIAMSDDGLWVAAGSGARKVYLWDTATGRARVMDGVEETAGALAFSPDGRALATSDVFGGVRVIDVGTWTSRRMAGAQTGATRLEFSPDGKLLVGRSVARLDAHVWNVSDGAERTFGDGPIVAAAFAGNALVVLSPKTLAVVDLATGARISESAAGGVPEDVRASGDTIVVALQDNRLVIQENGARRVVATSNDLRTLALAPNGRLAASCGLDSALWIWDLKAGTGRAMTHGGSGCSVMSFSPDASRIVDADTANHLQVRDSFSGNARVLNGHTALIPSAVFSRDGRTIASADADGAVRVWRLGDGDVRIRHGFTTFSPPAQDGKTLLTIAKPDLALALWNLETDTSTPISGPRHVWSSSGSLAADGRRVIFPSDAYEFAVWEKDRGTRTLWRSSLRHVADAISPDGAQIARSLEDGSIRIGGVDGQDRLLGRHESALLSMHFSPDGTALASGGRDRVIRVWDTKTGAVKELRGHTATVWDVAFSPDGARLVSASADSTVRVWQLATGEAKIFRGHLATVYSADFSPDGALVVSGGGDATVRLWDVASGRSRVMRRDAAAINFVHFTDGGTRVLSSGDAGTIWIWDLGATPGLDHDPTRLRAWMDAITTAEVDAASGTAASR